MGLATLFGGWICEECLVHVGYLLCLGSSGRRHASLNCAVRWRCNFASCHSISIYLGDVTLQVKHNKGKNVILPQG